MSQLKRIAKDSSPLPSWKLLVTNHRCKECLILQGYLKDISQSSLVTCFKIWVEGQETLPHFQTQVLSSIQNTGAIKG